MDATGATVAEKQTSPLTGAHDRLAELVMHLGDCPASTARLAVSAAAHAKELTADDDPLLIVARALVSLRRIDLRDQPAD